MPELEYTIVPLSKCIEKHDLGSAVWRGGWQATPMPDRWISPGRQTSHPLAFTSIIIFMAGRWRGVLVGRASAREAGGVVHAGGELEQTFTKAVYPTDRGSGSAGSRSALWRQAPALAFAASSGGYYDLDFSNPAK